MVSKLPYALVAALSAGLLYLLSAEAATPEPQTFVLEATRVDVSQPLAPGRSHAPINLPRHFANPGLLGHVKAALAASTKPSPQGKTGHGGKPTPVPTPSPSPSPTPSPLPISSGVSKPVATAITFDAMNLLDGGGFVPPDTIVAAGLGGSPASTLVLEAVNSLGAVYTTVGSLVVNLNTTACTTNSSTDSVSDPRVLFDGASGMWFISSTTFAPIGDASWNLLFSADPTSSTWYCLIVPTNTIGNPDGTVGNFPDFPKIGINTDKVVLTGDAYAPFGASDKFEGTEFVVISKSDLVNLSPNINIALYSPNQRDYAIEPAQALTPKSATESLYMAAVNSALASTSTIDVWTIKGVPGGTLQTKITSLPIATISHPPNAQQQGTNVLIDTNDDSLLDTAFRDGTPGSLWVSANDSCTPPGDSAVRSCLRFIDVSIDSSSGAMSVAEDFDYGDPGKYYYYPAIRTDSSGNLYAAFTGSSSGLYASAFAGMQLAGTMNALTNLSVFRAGDYPYTISPPRWGDYSGAAVDPGNASVWLGAEYATQFAIFGSIWGTAIAQAHP
jgi:hypothetical protein